MTSISTEDRARNFVTYGIYTDFEAAMEFGSYPYDEVVRAICMMNIRIAVFAFDETDHLVDDLDNLSTDTLCILAEAMAKKN